MNKLNARKIKLKIECNEEGYPFSESLYSDIYSYEKESKRSFLRVGDKVELNNSGGLGGCKGIIVGSIGENVKFKDEYTSNIISIKSYEIAKFEGIPFHLKYTV